MQHTDPAKKEGHEDSTSRRGTVSPRSVFTIGSIAHERSRSASGSTNYAEASIADYDERRGPLVEYWKARNGQQSGDPAKLARALITIASQEQPRGASSPAPMPLPPPSRRSLI